MVQFLLTRAARPQTGQKRSRPALFASFLCWCLCALAVEPLFVSVSLARPKAKSAGPVLVPELELTGGRKLLYKGSISSQKQVRSQHRFWGRLLDVVAGEPEFHDLIVPYDVATDSQGRIIVTDPGAGGIGIFDFARHKFKFISHRKDNGGLVSPQCVAVDAEDNIYATDSYSGKIFVFDAKGKFRRVIGNLKGGEGYFKRPTGIAVDSPSQRIYVTDTLRHSIFVLDMEGRVLQKIGRRGTGPGEFNYPTELRLQAKDLIVVDAMNFRVQVLDPSGKFEYAVGSRGDGTGQMFRPKGIGIDSEGHLYVVEGLSGTVQVFDRQGRLLYYLGRHGSGLGEFQLPAGLFIDREDFVYVVDSYDRRVEVFQYFGKER
ncbi:MAG TPA: 6-bladed beta-propeller [Terriglobia bacterium]|nr:6-bladed beta-propeller [Terriglobia bacterium]